MDLSNINSVADLLKANEAVAQEQEEQQEGISEERMVIAAEVLDELSPSQGKGVALAILKKLGEWHGNMQAKKIDEGQPEQAAAWGHDLALLQVAFHSLGAVDL